MTPPEPAAGPSLEFRVSVFYFALFMSSGLATVFAGIWFAGKGLSSTQIGIINSAPVLILMLINTGVGRIADRASDWRRVIVLGALASGVLPLGLVFVDGFWGILLVWTVAAVAHSAIVPVVDAAAMRLSARRGTDFAALRAWGSVGYLVVIVISGYLVAWLGGSVFVPLFVLLCLLRGLSSLWLPRFRAPVPERAPTPGATRLRQVMRPWFLLPLVGWSMIYATHLILNAFQGLLLMRQGLPVDRIGLLIALGALSESVMFFCYSRWFRRFPARRLIVVSALVSAGRWVAMGFSPGIAVLFALQSLHAVTFAIGFLASMAFITRWTSEDIAAEAQSFFVILQQGMAILALLAFGWLAGHWGAQAYFGAALFALAGGGLVGLSLWLQPARG